MTLYPPTTTIPVYSVFTGGGILLTGLRIYVRLSREKAASRGALEADDYWILVGLAVVITCTGIQYHNAIDGLSGEAASDRVSKAKILVEHKIDFSMIVIEKIAFGAIKLSLLYFYHGMFGFWPSFRRLNHAAMVLVALWAVSFFVADLLLCGRYPQYQWAVDQTMAKEKCGDKGALLIAFAATSVITDLEVLVLPLLYVRRLKLRAGKKIAASLVFLLGGLSTLAGVLRLIFLSVAYPLGRLTWGYKAPPHSETPLVLRAFNPTFYVMIEMCLGVWAANLPVLAPLARSVNERYKSSQIYRKLSVTTLVGRYTGNSESTVRVTHENIYLGERKSSLEEMYGEPV